MSEREQVLLSVLIQPASACWHAGAVGAGGDAIPLLRSQADSLSDYQRLEFDAQLSWLRHRFAGVLQRGCDRLFARNMKASHFVLIADGHFPQAPETLTQRLAEHFVDWMINPAVTYLLAPHGFAARDEGDFQLVAGELDDSVVSALSTGLPKLVARLDDAPCWELIVQRQAAPVERSGGGGSDH